MLSCHQNDILLMNGNPIFFYIFHLMLSVSLVSPFLFHFSPWLHQFHNAFFLKLICSGLFSMEFPKTFLFFLGLLWPFVLFLGLSLTSLGSKYGFIPSVLASMSHFIYSFSERDNCYQDCYSCRLHRKSVNTKFFALFFKISAFSSIKNWGSYFLTNLHFSLNSKYRQCQQRRNF